MEIVENLNLGFLAFCHPTEQNQLLWALEEGLRIVMSLVQSISHGEDFRTAIMYRFFLKAKRLQGSLSGRPHAQ